MLKNSIILATLLVAAPFLDRSYAQSYESNNRHSDAVGVNYTLLATSTLKLSKDITCEFVVMVDFSSSKLNLIRLNNRNSMHNANHFRNYPKNYQDYGKSLDLREIFDDLNVEELQKVEALVVKPEKVHELKVIAHLIRGEKQEARLSIEDFFTKQPKSCLY